MASAIHAAFVLSRGMRSIHHPHPPSSSFMVNPEHDIVAPRQSKKKKSIKQRLTRSSHRRRNSTGSIKLGGGSATTSSKLSSLLSPKKDKKAKLPHNLELTAPLVLWTPPPVKKKKSPVLKWLQHNCPSDVLPKILAYCGPQTVATLHGANKFWHATISKDQTWRVLCEDLYKWKEGDEAPDCSWRDFYQRNPCVPTDYPTVQEAVAALPTAAKHCTIWLRPQEHRLTDTIVVRQDVTLETMVVMGKNKPISSNKKMASLLLQTRRRNKPLLHIAQGHALVKRVRLGHYCGGYNLWNGNAAVQVQPAPLHSQQLRSSSSRSSRSPLPSATLDEVEIVSHSGRGVVINDGGAVAIARSYIHDCAATGIYVGSEHCHLRLEQSDLIANGHGNQLSLNQPGSRGAGVSRGHSGFYLEQGQATLRQVNISNNSSCGISVSSSLSTLTLESSDVVANGHAHQVEVASGAQQLGGHNTVARTGLVKVRSRLGLQSCANHNSRSSHRRRSYTADQVTASSSTANRGRRHSWDYQVEDDDDDDDDDLEHLQNSFVVAEENVRFGELIEV